VIAPILALITSFCPAQNSTVIETKLQDGDIYCDVEARNFPVHKLVTNLCNKAGIELIGFEDIDDSPMVTVQLKNRPLDVTVEYVLGAAGLTGSLTAKSLTVVAETPPFNTRDHALRAAEISFLTTLARFPNDEQASAARLALADIALLRGETEKAIHHYEILAEEVAETDLLVHLNARLKAGRLLISLEEWSRALPHMRYVAESQAENEIIVESRRQLARCVLMRGEAGQAKYMIDALDNLIDPLNSHDRADRLMIRARARIELGAYHDALRDLDTALRVSGGEIDEFEGMDLRARAMELDGRPIDAALGWARFSIDKPDDVKTTALVRAARMALSVDGEELGVIFLWKMADKDGLGDALMPFVNEARSRLGMDAMSYSDGTVSIRLNRAVQLVSAGLPEESFKVLGTIGDKFIDLSSVDRMRYAMTFAPLLEVQLDVPRALRLLRTVIPTMESQENRTKLYLMAGEIHERAGDFEAAAAAYGGEL
jgi:tetratricopeptide (TPR) repeat protein